MNFKLIESHKEEAKKIRAYAIEKYGSKFAFDSANFDNTLFADMVESDPTPKNKAN